MIALVCLLAAKLINVYVPMLYKLAIDRLGASGGAPSGMPAAVTLPIGLILAYGAARVLSQGFGEFRDFIFARVAQHAQRVIALDTFKHLHSLSLAFHLERQTGGLSRVIERGARGIQFVLSFMLFNILPTLLEIGLVTVILAWTCDIRFAIATLVTIVVYIAFTLGITEWRTKYRREMNETDSQANTKAIDSLLNYETVKYFGNEEHEYARFDASLSKYEDAAVRSQSSLSALNFGQGLIIGAGLVSVMWMAAQGVVDGRMTVGDFVLVNTYLIQLYLPLNFLGFVYREMKQGLIDMEKMFELLRTHVQVVDAHGARALAVKGGEIQFENVFFGYSAARPILKGVSFTVRPGETVAIVGASGAGKSTISRLLYRFYDVNAGVIRIDGQDIREVTQGSLRKNIGIVPQDTVLFNDTVGYNIRYGRTDASMDDVIHAARMAKIHDFIETLPDKYETRVGERGLKLSGGEKQRVAIARTILKNPKVLLFDEATSALDSHTEKQIQASLEEVSRDKTTLVIAHRLSTIVHSNEILVLRDGVIVERGTHTALLEKNGEYADLWNRQQEAQQIQAKLAQVMSQGPS